MIEVRLLDEKWMEETVNSLLVANETITVLEEDVYKEAGYQEAEQTISMIEQMAAGTVAEDMLSEYRDAIEIQSGYRYNAAYLVGIKKGFQLATFLKQG